MPIKVTTFYHRLHPNNHRINYNLYSCGVDKQSERENVLRRLLSRLRTAAPGAATMPLGLTVVLRASRDSARPRYLAALAPALYSSGASFGPRRFAVTPLRGKGVLMLPSRWCPGMVRPVRFRGLDR
jgi:hypothetical protein